MRRYRSSHSRSNSLFRADQDYPANERPSTLVTPTAQIGLGGSSRGRHAHPAPHVHEHHHGHHGHHHHHHNKQGREGPTPFDDDGDNSSVDNEMIQRDANGGYGDNFEIPHRMLRIIMPELFEHLNESYNEPHLMESVNFSSRYTSEEGDRPRQRPDLETIMSLNKQRVASLADDAWMYEAEEDPNSTRHKKQLYQSR
ncbi:hypothetical protein DRE_06221 [Drechslerella stenobrocha 248]|uniref:Uncharacterized protein n=1 Tax=Drechslerella stenobrocha 248 TaxID=1043628 RepID=W7HY77_9PEZI|nr:hypothetical protein DRE_06221 [Drechslerella stenobrocha 248]